MAEPISVVLDYQNAPAAWGKAHISFDGVMEGTKAKIHLGEGDLFRQVQAAARQLTLQGITEVRLEGEEWNPILQWRFACGFGTAQHAGTIHWASFAEQLESQRQAQLWLKDLINATPQALSPEILADEVAEHLTALAPHAITSKQIVGDALLTAGWVGIHAVGRGSERPPVLLELDYNPTGESDAPVNFALVGKGITFDSGGYSMKPSDGMLTMKADMGGAATAAAALKFAIERGLDKRVKLFLCCAENLVSGHAYKLGDVLHYKNGVSVEIVNTDAEGRLVLADGLIAANEANAECIIDVATLTGAASVALGEDYNALFSLDDEAAEAALDAAAEVDEGLWRLPLEPFHAEKCPSYFADTANSRAIKGGGAGGASNAAGFLSRFAGEPPFGWLHFDLSGCYAKTDTGLNAAGATGMGMLTIANVLLRA